jgi:recombination protein RecT
MAVNNTLTPVNGEEKVKFGVAIQSPKYQALINSTLRDPKRANRFVASVMSAVTANSLLQNCTPASVITAALQGEALELSPSPTLGEYYLVPYKKSVKDPNTGEWIKIAQCQFQIGTAGRIQLAMRTGQYKDLDAVDVRQGEYRGRNPETGKPVIKFYEDEDMRENLPVIGYLGYFLLTNGFYHSVYFTVEQCLKWAERYSKSFDRKLYDKVKNGEKLDWKEEQAATQPWIAHTEEMCKNLVLRRALKNAPKSIEMRNIVEGDEKTDADISSAFDGMPTGSETPEQKQIGQQQAENDFFGDEPQEEEQPLVEEKPKRGRKKSEPVAEEVAQVELG